MDTTYDVYGNRIATSTGGGAAYVAPVETTEYASTATASSFYDGMTSNPPSEATGAPDVTGMQHDDTNAWAASDPDGSSWLQLAYATPINVDDVTITESYNAGFVTEIDLIEPNGTSHTFSGITDGSSSSGAIVDFTYTLSSQTTYLVDQVRIVVNGDHVIGNWEEIDAVKIHGYTPAVGTIADPVVTHYALDGWNPAKSNPVGNEDYDVWADINQDGTLATHYMLGDQVDQILARVDVTAPSDSTTGAKWYLTDQQASLRTLIGSTGAEIISLRYDAFGNVTAVDSAYSSDPLTEVTDVAGRYQWTGREVDAETGLQYNRARWYDSSTGRWISQDPMGFDAGDSNLYRYVKNSPTNATDPSGDVVFAIHGVATDGKQWYSEMARDFKKAWEKGYKQQPVVPIEYGSFTKEQIAKYLGSTDRSSLKNSPFGASNKFSYKTPAITNGINQLLEKIQDFKNGQIYEGAGKSRQATQQEKDQPINIIAHSNGTMVALDTMLALPAGTVKTAVLLASPLDLRNKDNLKKIDQIAAGGTKLYFYYSSKDVITSPIGGGREPTGPFDPNIRFINYTKVVSYENNVIEFDKAPTYDLNQFITEREKKEGYSVGAHTGFTLSGLNPDWAKLLGLGDGQ